MEPTSLAILIKRYIHDELSDEEVTQLWETLRDEAHREQWETAMAALLEEKSAHGLSDPAKMDKMWALIQPQGRTRQMTYGKWRWVAAAALVAAMAGAGTYALLNRHPQTVKMAIGPVMPPTSPIQPGTDKAVLTLADGTQVPLDSAGNGAVAVQGNSRIRQQRKGQLIYTADGTASTSQVQYNNLHIPRGGQFRITLSDGTKVWLNAASDLRYPTAFNGSERRVELTGEAYFEVVQMPSRPFKVMVNNTEVQVLGTSFNVKAYGDEAITKTTLLDGAVNIKTGDHETRLRPGQQAQVQVGGQITVKDEVDVDEVVAWKNGYFQFNHEKITGVMSQLSRWYDLDVSYQGNIPAREFGGRIARSSSIEEIIRILELSKIHVKIDNKKIIVLP